MLEDITPLATILGHSNVHSSVHQGMIICPPQYTEKACLITDASLAAVRANFISQRVLHADSMAAEFSDTRRAQGFSEQLKLRQEPSTTRLPWFLALCCDA